MLKSLVKRNSKSLDYEVTHAAKQWDAEVVSIDTTDNNGTCTLKNEEIGTFETSIVKAICDGCGERFIALIANRDQIYICTNCGHYHEATTEELDKAGVDYTAK